MIPIAVVLSVLTRGSDSYQPWLQAWGVAVLLGLVLELGQYWIEERGVSPYDMLAN
jgi:hypothetical protein